MLTDQQIEMLTDQQLRAKLKRLERRWCRLSWRLEDRLPSTLDPQKHNKLVELSKKLSKLESEYFKRDARKG